VCVCVWCAYPRKRSQIISFASCRESERERLREKTQKAKNQTPAAAANCEAAKATTARRPDRSASRLLLPPPSAPHLTRSPRQTPRLVPPFRVRLSLRSGKFFFFSFPLLFCSYLLLVSCYLLTLLLC
jgi:hypothetical protein